MRDARGKLPKKEELIKKEEFDRLYVPRWKYDILESARRSQFAVWKAENQRANDWKMRAFMFASVAAIELFVLVAVTHG
jgi:hypothetical protein